MVGKKNNLSAALSQGFCGSSANAGSSPLKKQLVGGKSFIRRDNFTVIMTTLECIKRSEVFLAPPKYSFRSAMGTSHKRPLNALTVKATAGAPLKMLSNINGRGIVQTVIDKVLDEGSRGCGI